ncbi:MAG: DUF6800 family protein [Planctomycetaceae bacterium]|nr:DUF6800 family protein [Planctomycetaceae bacterium]
MPRIERDRELAKRRQRKVKLEKLVARFSLATSSADKEVLAAKVRRISPFYDINARLAQLAEMGRTPVAAKPAMPAKKK